MLDSIVRASVKNRGVVIALAVLALGYGIFVAARSRLDVFPEFAPPQVVIQTEASGYSPRQVERLVTLPIEAAVGGVSGLKVMRSQSIQGFSLITLFFGEDSDVYLIRQLTSERLSDVARSLPLPVKAPILSPLTSSTSLVLMTALLSDRINPMELRTIAEWDLKPRLLAVPGVSKVVLFGGEVRQLQIQVDPGKLERYGIGFQELVGSAALLTAVKGAGFIETTNERITLHSQGQALSPGRLAEAVIRRSQGLNVRLKDVATVTFGPEPKYGDAQVGGKPGVLVEVSGQYGSNTLQVTEAAERELARMEPYLKQRGIRRTDLFRPADFVHTALRNVTSALLIGGILVIFVLFVFLWNARVSLISLTAIPLSLLLSILALSLTGMTLNAMTLGGLAIAIGEVVDDAVIDVENIFRRLRERRGQLSPVSRLRTVFEASIEVRHSVVYATLVVALVFLPVIRMRGLQGKLFSPLGYAYVFSILASLLVALTLTPALSAVLLTDKALEHGEPRGVTSLKRAYRRALTRIIEAPKAVMATALVLFAAAVTMLPFFSGSFLPEFKEGHFIVHMSAIPGTSMEESLRIGKRVTAALEAVSGVKSVAQQIGRAERADDIYGPYYSEIHVDLEPLNGEEMERAEARIREALARFPGLYFSINPFLTERIEETFSGAAAEMAVKLFGQDLRLLDAAAQRTAAMLSRMRGARNVRLEARPTVPELEITLNEDALSRRGFQPVPVLDAIETAYEGTAVTQVYEANRVIDVVVMLTPSQRRDPLKLGELLLRNPDGAWATLRDLATIRLTTGRYAIFHENSRRLESVAFDVEGRDLSSLTRELEGKLKAPSFLPASVTAAVAGATQAKSEAQRDLLVQSLLAAGGIILLLWVALRSGRNLLLVLANLPFALIGGVFLVFASGGLLNLGSLVGFVSLFGISTRNSIMLISHFQHLVEKEGATWCEETAIRGATERLLPIVMTATVTALGLLPIALGGGDPGREIEGPMALVILGGLLSSTALNLFVTPTLALRFGKFPVASAEW